MEVKIVDNTGLYDPHSLEWDQTIEFPNSRKLQQYGNRIYNRYPARSIFLVPRATIYYLSKKNRTLNVLDPFMGSGTTAVEASNFSAKIYGTEMDPFARLIAEVSIMRFNRENIDEIKTIYEDIKHNWTSADLDFLLKPDLKNIEYWFDSNIFEDLLRLKSYIYNNNLSEKYLKFFKVVFADSIKPSSRMERQSTKPYISSKYIKVIKPVSESFESSFKSHINALEQYLEDSKKYVDEIKWLSYDATDFKGANNKIDLAITSPPYLNAFDYTQIVKIDSAWVGTMKNDDVEILRHKQVGHAKRKDQKVSDQVVEEFKVYADKLLNAEKKSGKMSTENLIKVCEGYFNDILKNLSCVYKALKSEGQYHMIIGDNVINNIEIPTHKIIASLAEKIGFNWTGYYKYPIKDHRTSIPRKDNGGKIKYEFVIILTK